jgi:cell division protease FtsH
MVSMMLGGHAAIKIIENDIYTGAQSDLKRATDVIRTMVTKLGMSDALGTIYLGSDQEVFVGMEFGKSRDYSEDYAQRIDNEVSNLISKCYDVAMNTIKANIGKLHGLAKLLIEKETVNREDFLGFMNSPVSDGQLVQA